MSPAELLASPFPRQAATYRKVLRLLPGPLVREHGDDMVALFCHHLAAARGSRRAWFGVWSAALRDVLQHAPRLPRRSIGAPDPHRNPRQDQTMNERLRTLMATLGRDASFGLRLLRKDWSFTLAATLILGLAIGANTAVFSFVDTYMMRPLPYPDAHRLALVTTGQEGRGPGGEWVDGRTWEAVRDAGSDGFQAAVYTAWRTAANLATGSTATTVGLQRVGTGYFGALGVPPTLGREFTPEEDVPGGAPVCILSHVLWQRLFSGSPAAVGDSVLLRGEPHTVVGIMPESFRSAVTADLWTPLRPTTTGEGGGTNYRILLRLGADTSWAQAETELEAIGRGLDDRAEDAPRILMSLAPLQARDAADMRTMMMLLGAAVGMVLLIACVNVSGLLLARGNARGREVATRMAIGGGRAAIVRQFVVESVVLAATGGLAGVLFARGMMLAIETLGSSVLNVWRPVSLDLRVLLGTGAISLITALLFGLAPALQASRVSIHDALRTGGGRGVAGGSGRWRKFMVIAEVGLCVVLLVAAGLLLRTFLHLQGLDPGFDTKGVVSISASLQDARYETRESAEQLFNAGIERVRALPTTISATAALGMPYQRLLNLGFQPVDFELDEGTNTTINVVYVSPDYFETLGVPILAGRGLDASDSHDSLPVAVVNQAFVDFFMDGGAAVGHALRTAGADRQIVGMVGNIKQRDSFGQGTPVDDTRTLFVPVSQVDGEFLKLVHTWFAPSWIVRFSGDPSVAVPAIERALGTVDPLLPLAAPQLVTELQANAVSVQRFLATLVGVLGAIAMALAGLGIYGLVASTVAERRREIGIRLALGARAAHAVSIAALPTIRLAVIGGVLGVAGSLAAGRALQAMLWGVAPNDPWTYAGVALGLVIAAATASLIPAARAAGVDPAQTLRVE